MTKDVNMKQLQKDAVDIFNQGFACSESIIYAIKKNFELVGEAVFVVPLPAEQCVLDTFLEEKLRVILELTNVLN